MLLQMKQIVFQKYLMDRRRNKTMPTFLQILLVPVIIACALGGTVTVLKLIRKFFPDSGKIVDKTEEWIEKHK